MAVLGKAVHLAFQVRLPDGRVQPLILGVARGIQVVVGDLDDAQARGALVIPRVRGGPHHVAESLGGGHGLHLGLELVAGMGASSTATPGALR